MNKATTIQVHWIDLGHEPSDPDENGWIDFDFLPDDFFIGNLESKSEDGHILVRPKSLKGIEDNNGWQLADLQDMSNIDDLSDYWTGRFDEHNNFRQTKYPMSGATYKHAMNKLPYFKICPTPEAPHFIYSTKP